MRNTTYRILRNNCTLIIRLFLDILLFPLKRLYLLFTDLFEPQEEDYEDEPTVELIGETSSPDVPEMCQIFPVNKDMVIGIEYVSLCPEETAHIRILGDKTYSEQYKRKVYYDRGWEKDRYIKLNGMKLYLDKKKTKPINPVQAKIKK